jgi:SAM-dependent methyltransferase
MGFNKIMTRYLFTRKEHFHYSGKVLTLGKQDIGVTHQDIREIAGSWHASGESTLTDDEYLKWLGFSSVDSLEYSTMDGATIAHDLNKPLPKELYNKFDWIIDGGTLEHCFDVREFMSTMIRLLKPGGHILHINPSIGSCNHGMFNFQPTFYFSFYRANDFSLLECDLLEMFVKPKNIFLEKDARARVIPIENYNNLAFSTEHPTYNVFHAMKPVNYSNSEIATPIQEFYYRIFKEKQKVGGGLINDELYKEIRGDSEENTQENILKKSYWL